MPRVSRKSRKRESPSADRALLITVFGLLVFGVVMVYDATVFYSQHTFGEASKFVLLQVVWSLLGLLGFWFFYNLNYKNICRLAQPLSLVTVLILGALAFFGFLKIIGVVECSESTLFVPCINGAYRWFYLNPPPFPKIPFAGVLGFQPAELAKFSLIVYLAVQLSKKPKGEIDHFVVFICATLFVAGLILIQPNMSTAALVFLIGSAMYFAAEAPLLPFFVSLPILGTLGIFGMLSSSYRRQRFMTLLGLSGESDLSTGYHIKQILIALGSGGLWGVGFGQSRQKYQYLPEVSADSIFAIIGEELGFLGTVAIVLVFCFLIYKGYSIAKNAPDLLGRLLAVGVTSWIGLQFFVNVAAMTRVIPLTGVPIPLISYGGSATVFSLMGLGILANVSRYSKS